MDPLYTPFDDLPERLRVEMQLLQDYKDHVTLQACKVVNVAVTELKHWKEAEARAACTAAALRQVRELPNNCEGSAGAVHNREAQACLEPFTSGGRIRETSKRKQRDRSARSAITGYFGVRREPANRYRARVNRISLGTFDTAEQAAHAYDGAALRDNIALGFDKHQLNFSRAKPKQLATQHHTQELLREDTSEPGLDHTER